MSIKQGEYLKELRVKNSLSQEKLAEKLGLSRQSVSKWEQGLSTPDTENLIKLSQLYGVSVDTLLSCGERTHNSVNDVMNQQKKSSFNKEEEDRVDKLENEEKKNRSWFFIAYPFIAVIAYVLIGVLFGGRGWASGWILILTVPLYYSTVFAKEKKNPLFFLYPFAALIVYLICGFAFSLWHPLWIVFLTIPLYYVIAARAYKK